jgi:glycosyltransferase involved in cell wall biosynthesis
MKVSILIPYYNRPEVFERSLWLLIRQSYHNYELVIVDDGSRYPVQMILPKIADYYPRIKHFPIRTWDAPIRSPNMAWRKAYQECTGDFIITTHPEIMVPLDAIEIMLEHHDPERRSVPTQYCVPGYRQQHRIDRVDWKTNLSSLNTLPDFWSDRGPWGYTNMEARRYHHHLSFSGQLREQWERIGFLPAVEANDFQGDDSWIHAREMAMDRPAKHIPELEVYHQDHERIYGTVPNYSVRIQRMIETDKVEARDWNPPC